MKNFCYHWKVNLSWVDDNAIASFDWRWFREVITLYTHQIIEDLDESSHTLTYDHEGNEEVYDTLFQFATKEVADHQITHLEIFLLLFWVQGMNIILKNQLY